MAYSIYKSNGDPVSVPDNAIDAQFYSPNLNGAGRGVGTQLVGRNSVDYGAPVAQNFLQLTENFCGPLSPPANKALRGQLWFNSTTGLLNVNVSTTATPEWRGLMTIASSDAVTGYDGQVKVDGSVISIWADGAWRQIYPAVYS